MLGICPTGFCTDQLPFGDHQLLLDVRHLRLCLDELLGGVLDSLSLTVVAVGDVCAFLIGLGTETRLLGELG